jgi:hypothetical protein
LLFYYTSGIILKIDKSPADLTFVTERARNAGKQLCSNPSLSEGNQWPMIFVFTSLFVFYGMFFWQADKFNAYNNKQ